MDESKPDPWDQGFPITPDQGVGVIEKSAYHHGSSRGRGRGRATDSSHRRSHGGSHEWSSRLLVWIVLAQVPTTPLTGTVVGPGGEPVVGADLILVGLPSYDPPIVARGKSGEGGRFTLDRPTALAGDHHPQRAPILWAVKPGFRVSVTRFPEALPKADEPVRIVLPPPGRAEVRVEGPDGQPLGGVRVLPERLKTHFTALPDVVAELASTTTDQTAWP